MYSMSTIQYCNNQLSCIIGIAGTRDSLTIQYKESWIFDLLELSFPSCCEVRPMYSSLRSSVSNDESILEQIQRLDKLENDKAANKGVPFASFLLAMVGVGYLFPFSALTQPVDYWNILFPDFNIEFPLTVIYMYTNLLMLGILVFMGETPETFTPRIIGGFTGQLLLLLFVPTSYFFHLSESQNTICILGSTAAIAIVTAFLDSSVIALASQYPLRVQESFQLGIGISTLIGSIYRDVTKLLFPPEKTVESSLLYFYSGAATIALCIVAYFKLMSLDISKRSLSKSNLPKNEQSPLLPQTHKPVKIDRKEVYKKIWFNELMVCFTFVSTLALWPPLITEISSFNHPHLQATGWWPLILLTVFSLSDCIGRILVRFRLATEKSIWTLVLGRLILFPLLICSAKGIIFTNDWFSILFTGLLGLTNGYVGTLSIVLVNECISDAEQHIAGTVTSFSINSGLVLGATVGMIVEAYL